MTAARSDCENPEQLPCECEVLTILAVAEFGPRPAAAAGGTQPRAPMIPGSFSVLVFGQ
jgi:hypothetical protein